MLTLSEVFNNLNKHAFNRVRAGAKVYSSLCIEPN